MILIACTVCRLAIRAQGNPEEMDHLVGQRSDWYPDKYPCPRSECTGLMVIADAVEPESLGYLEIHDLSPQESFQAFMGLGLPEEKDCNVSLVRQLMRGSKIISLDLHGLPGTQRSILHSLLLESGVRVYLGTSPQGVVVYRVVPPRSLTQEILDE